MLQDKQYIINNEIEMGLLAVQLAETVKIGDVIFLLGNLGVGKTTFARALIRKLINDQSCAVPSPTFTLVQYYDNYAIPIWHFDLYRLQNGAEVLQLGIEEALAKGLTIIEWPEKLGNFPMPDPIVFAIDYVSDTERTVAIKMPNRNNICKFV